MRKLLVILFLFCSVCAFAQNKPSAVDQMHNAMTQSLANTEYYDEAHQNIPNAHGVATRENLTGEAELLRQGIGAPFVENKGGRYSKGATPTQVRNYITHSTADPNHEIVMPSTVEIPPVSAPVLVGDDEADDMFLDALGGASKANSYKGDYETAVGKQQERNFDMSEQLSQAAVKQDQANAKFANDVAIAKQKQAEEAQRQAQQQQQGYQSEKKEPGFWGKLGKIAMQGMVNVGIEATNYKYGTNIETIGNKPKSSGGNNNQTCSLNGNTFHGDSCTYCVLNKPRSSSDCNKCCRSFGRSLMQAPSYSATASRGGRPAGCLCRFGPTSGYLF